MPKFTVEKNVKHSAQKMFNLVADVESYPQFVPMCERLEIISRNETSEGAVLIAEMTIGYKCLTERFTTKVILNRHAKTIDVSYIDGPFKYLENSWSFFSLSEAENSCQIRFFIDYSFKNPMFSMLLGGLFDNLFKKFTDAFEQRADNIYGAS